jgi:diguanylate cyclase (GGDEF)-like protein/PAS domain S-box-containing protein
MIKRLLPARRRFTFECAGIGVLTLLWLVCLVLGLGGQQTTQAISNFGLIAAAAFAGLACLATARNDSCGHQRMWRLLGASALSWGSGQAAWTCPLLGGGLVAWAVADSGFVYLIAVGSYSSGALIDAGWFVGYVLILLAARRAATGPAAEPADPEAEDRAERPAGSDQLGLLLPYVAVAGALVVSTVVQVQHGRLGPFVGWVRSFIILALVGRQILTLLENSSLARHLEARVVERTAELRASEQRFQALVQHSSEVVILVDADGRVEYVSESMTRLFGYRDEELLGRPLSGILDPDAAVRLREGLAEVAERPYGVLELELPLRHRDRHQCTAQFTVTNLLDSPGVGGLVLNTRDISERRRLEDQLVHQAFHDSLTSLANRALFKDRVDHALQRTKRQTPSVAVLFVDLDGFKEVNDSLGHAAGDRLLIQVAERLRSCVRPSDTVARFGGDEFAVLIEDASDDVDVTQVAERVLEGLARPFVVNDRELHVRGSMGIARMESDVDGADHLLRNADLAMYRAKAAGQGGYERYDPQMHTELVQRVQLEADLRRTLDTGELFLHFQPTIDLASGQVVGAEALARWQHPTRGWSPRPSSSPWPRPRASSDPWAPGCCGRPAGRRPSGSAAPPTGTSRWPSASTSPAASSRSPRWSRTWPPPWARATCSPTRWCWR